VRPPPTECHEKWPPFGATGTPTTEQVCVDGKRQWRQAGNIRHNSAIRSGLWTMTHPRSMLRRRDA